MIKKAKVRKRYAERGTRRVFGGHRHKAEGNLHAIR